MLYNREKFRVYTWESLFCSNLSENEIKLYHERTTGLMIRFSLSVPSKHLLQQPTQPLKIIMLYTKHNFAIHKFELNFFLNETKSVKSFHLPVYQIYFCIFKHLVNYNFNEFAVYIKFPI